MTASPRYRTRWIVTVVLAASVVLLVAIGMAAFDAAQDRWAWRLADLDRNGLHLSPDAGSIDGGSVVEESPSDLVVEYSRPVNDWTGQPTGAADTVCYRFPLADPDEFREVPCP